MNISARDILQQSNTQIINCSTDNKNNSILKQTQEDKKQQNKSMIYAGDLNLQQDTIGTKKAQAQKKAMKSLIDQFKSDAVKDEDLSERKIHQSELSEEALAAQEEIRKLQSLREDLKESYGIDDESDEQKNLELLEKSMDGTQELSDEEMEQLENMGPLTEYQKSALKYDAYEAVWKQRADDANQAKENEGRTIDSIKLESLKYHPMVDAQEEAAGIMEAASNEIIGTIMQQTKEHIDEEQDENEKKAEEQAEEQEDNKVKKEDSEQNSETNSTDQPEQVVSDQEELLNDIKYLIKKNNIIDEDAKGIVLDEQI